MEEIVKSFSSEKELIIFLKEILIVLGIGILLGLEREFSGKGEEKSQRFAGVRTFPIVSILGYISLYVASEYSIWIYIAAFFGVVSITAASHFMSDYPNPGTTTEFALFSSFFLGSFVFLNEYQIAVVTAIILFTLLAFKIKMHNIVSRLSEGDIFSILQFIIITVLILPVLPNESYGPYEVFNPYKIWLIISIFVSLNFVGYFLDKFFDSKNSILMTGIFGGLASSTATTWFFSRQSSDGEAGKMQASAVILASSIMFPRLLIWLLFLNVSLLSKLWIPVLCFGAAVFIAGLYMSKLSNKSDGSEKPEVENPINIKEALIFGSIYVTVLFIVGYTNERFGTEGVLVASAISGVSGIDAIVVSMANYGKKAVDLNIASAAILIGAFANTLFKYIICLSAGSKSLKKLTGYVFIPLIILGSIYTAILLMS